MASNNGLIIGLAVAAGGYYAYTQGWLSSLFGTPATTTAAPAAPVVVQATTPSLPLTVVPSVPVGPAVKAPVSTSASTTATSSTGTGSTSPTTASGSTTIGVPRPPIVRLAGLGRLAIALPRRHEVIVLPRNYFRRGRVA